MTTECEHAVSNKWTVHPTRLTIILEEAYDDPQQSAQSPDVWTQTNAHVCKTCSVRKDNESTEKVQRRPDQEKQDRESMPREE